MIIHISRLFITVLQITTERNVSSRNACTEIAYRIGRLKVEVDKHCDQHNHLLASKVAVRVEGQVISDAHSLLGDNDNHVQKVNQLHQKVHRSSQTKEEEATKDPIPVVQGYLFEEVVDILLVANHLFGQLVVVDNIQLDHILHVDV